MEIKMLSKKFVLTLILLVICCAMLVMPVMAEATGTIVGWGDYYYGAASPPAGNDYVAIAAGAAHSLALKSDGSIVGWGWNELGQASPPAGNDYVAIAAGNAHSLALKSDGSIVGWGANYYGQASPPAGNDYVAIAAGDAHSLALKSDGSIVGWGADWYGQISQIPAGNDYIAIAAGQSHSLALKSDGSIVGWGNNNYGQASPPAGNDYVAIAVGHVHSLALKSDGSIVGWGWNEGGQASPPAGNDYVAIAAGNAHSLALKNTAPTVATDNNDPVSVDEGQTATNTGTWSDPDMGDTVTLTASVGNILKNIDGTWSWSYVTKDGPAQTGTVTITATDSGSAESSTSFTLNVDNVPPSVDAFSVPTDPVKQGTALTVSASFSDPGILDTHTAVWDWGDGTTPRTVDETGGSGTVSGSHTYLTPGIYTIKITVTDKDGSDSEVKLNYITVSIPVNVRIVPQTLNLGSKGYFLAFVTLPDAYKGATVDMKTVSCSGAQAIRMTKLKIFPRIVGFVFKISDLKDIQPGKRVILNVKGKLKNNGATYTFTGSDSVKVISKPSWQPDDIKDVSKVSDDQLFKKYSI